MGIFGAPTIITDFGIKINISKEFTLKTIIFDKNLTVWKKSIDLTIRYLGFVQEANLQLGQFLQP